MFAMAIGLLLLNVCMAPITATCSTIINFAVYHLYCYFVSSNN